MGLRTQCEAERDEDEEGKGTFLGVYFPSVLFFNPVILVGKRKGGEQCKSGI